MQQSSTGEPDETRENAGPDPAEVIGTDLFERLKQRHADVPDELIAEQVSNVTEGIGLLGNDPALIETATEALEANLNRLGAALRAGAGLAGDPEAATEPTAEPATDGPDDDAPAAADSVR